VSTGMFQVGDELRERIRAGEDSTLELREVRMSGSRVAGPSRDSLADELAAFANSRGGTCVLGVNDTDREVVGIPIEHLDRVEDLAREVCNDTIQPPLAASIRKVAIRPLASDDLPRYILVIEVPRSMFVHRGPGGYLHRVGSSKREMAPDFLARLFQQRSQARIIRFDEQAVPMANLDDLSEELWRRFESRRVAVQDSREDFLHKLGLARREGDDIAGVNSGAWRPTVAGVLMATEDPRRFIPNAFIQAVAYRGGTMAIQEGESSAAYQLDAADITGPLDRQVTEALRFVARNMKTLAVKTIGRVDIPQFDLGAVFESLVNAVAHRDYAIYGSKIRLRIYSDRLEIYSPGALVNTMTVDSLPLRQAARNEVLTSLLARCVIPKNVPEGLLTDRATMMDKRGEGVGLVLERTYALAGRLPQYRVIDEQELQLIIPAAQGPLPTS
jgi:ATP-dependent DNA helicase RecG